MNEGRWRVATVLALASSIVAVASSLLGFPLPGPAVDAAAPDFVDVTEAAGIDFHHVNGAFGEKWMPESLGAGVAVFDADGDGWQDLYFAQGTAWEGHEEAVAKGLRDATGRLYLNQRDGSFADVTTTAGLDFKHYGFGAAPADYDNDGWTDLYLTAYGANKLLHNEEDGVFKDVTEAAGVGHPGWGTSAAWVDFDRDGDLDLYVANYVRWSPQEDIWCTLDGMQKSYCTPESYTGEPSILYRNEGNGSFIDVSRGAGVHVEGGKSLGITVADFNDDGWPDLAVANDTEPNFLFENRQDGTFHEVGVVSGVAFDANGRARAGMGIDTADARNSGSMLLAVGNFSNEMIGLFERAPGGVFVDVAPRSAVGRSSLLSLTFGLFFFDVDLDGWLDLFAVNGHLEDRIGEIQAQVTHAQRPLLFRNDPERDFELIEPVAGSPLERTIVGRGTAYLDFDRDGDLDIVVTENDGPAYLWRNLVRDGDDRPSVLRVRLVGTDSNRDGIGAKVTVRSGDWQQVQMVRSGSSFASQSELALTFGLGGQSVVDAVRVDWPSGRRTELPTADLHTVVEHEILVDELAGLVDRVALGRRVARR